MVVDKCFTCGADGEIRENGNDDGDELYIVMCDGCHEHAIYWTTGSLYEFTADKLQRLSDLRLIRR